MGKANLPYFDRVLGRPRQICLISAGPWARQIWAGTLVGKANLLYLGWVGILVGKGLGLCFLMLWDSRVGGCYVYTLDTTEP